MKLTTLFLFLVFTISLFSQSEIRKCIFFENNQYELTKENTSLIKNHILNIDTSQYIQLLGYANHFGDYNSNLELSKKRANSIKALMIENGFPKNRIELNFQGEKFAKQNQNSIIESRRVDIVSYYKSPKKDLVNTIRDKNWNLFTINPNRDTTLICKEGTKLTIKANSFVYENTEKIAKEKVEIKVQEFYKKSDFILYSLSTRTEDNQLLESGGMINIVAKESDNKLSLAKGEEVKIEFPTKNKKEGMKLFSGTETAHDVAWKLNEPNGEVYSIVEQMPEFPGGDEALMTYISRNIKYPAKALDNEISGTVIVNFVVNENGKIGNVRVTKGLGYGLNEEAIRVIKTMPRWKPGMQGGTGVKVYFDVPINFAIEGVNSVNIGIYTEDNTHYTSKNFKEKRKKLEAKLIKNKDSVSVEEIGYYMLSSPNLGWINCDRFYNMPRTDFAVKIENATDKFISLVFKKFNSVYNDYSAGKNCEFKNLPQNQHIDIVVVKSEKNKKYLSITPSNTSKKSETISDFKEVNLEELKAALERLN